MTSVVQSNVSLQPLNTLAVPARASYLQLVHNSTELKDALAFASARQLPVLVVGGGSNIVLQSDFSGLVVHLLTRGITVEVEDDEHLKIAVAAGEDWHALVSYCLKQSWYGLENLALIPGTVGAAPVQNIGAYGVELADLFVSLDAVHIPTGETRTFSKSECQFGYRQSFFKGEGFGQYVITRVYLQLHKQPQLQVRYPGLQRMLSEQLGLTENMLPVAILDGRVTPSHVFAAVCELRKRKLPDPDRTPNVGSFFKNPVVDAKLADSLMRQFPQIVTYPAASGVKLAAGWLIEQAGWKGYNADGQNPLAAGVHAQQALVLVNPNRVSGVEVLALASRIKSSVADKFGVDLEIEPFIVGE